MGTGENDMEVGGTNNFSPAFIHPDFFLHSLAVRAVTVFTGIIVKFGMSAVGADRDIAAQPAGFTV